MSLTGASEVLIPPRVRKIRQRESATSKGRRTNIARKISKLDQDINAIAIGFTITSITGGIILMFVRSL